MNSWHLYPLTNASGNSPAQRFDGDTPPTTDAIKTALGIVDDGSPSTFTDPNMTKVLDDYYLYSFGYAGAACVYACVRRPTF